MLIHECREGFTHFLMPLVYKVLSILYSNYHNPIVRSIQIIRFVQIIRSIQTIRSIQIIRFLP